MSDNIADAEPILAERLKAAPAGERGMAMFQAQQLLARAKDKAGAAAMLERLVAPYGATLEAHVVLAQAAYGRGDIYHSNDAGAADIAYYRGSEGWQGRAIGALAADLRYPLIGTLFGGTQRLAPRVQLVLTPPTRNLSIPNEDARAVDREDSNLFALNRFPGYDRWEDGSRITYGVEWNFDRGLWAIQSIVGQSYRITRSPGIFPDGTGLTDRLSDVVYACPVMHSQVSHRRSLLPQKCFSPSCRRVSPADNLSRFVDNGGTAVWASKRAEVGHAAVLIQKCMSVTIFCLGVSNDGAIIIYCERRAVHSTESSEIGGITV
jgi:hypothetical protein